MIDVNTSGVLIAAGLPSRAVADWVAAVPAGTSDFVTDCCAYGAFWAKGAHLVSTLPKKPARSDAERAGAEAILSATREIAFSPHTHVPSMTS